MHECNCRVQSGIGRDVLVGDCIEVVAQAGSVDWWCGGEDLCNRFDANEPAASHRQRFVLIHVSNATTGV